MSTNPATILAVEDGPVQAELLRRDLEDAGYRVLAASDGAAALRLASVDCPDAVVTDIRTPIMDGFGLCREIRRNPKLKAIPILLLTTLSDPVDVIRGLNAGADAYVTKPYSPPALISRLNTLLLDSPAPPAQAEQIKLTVKLGGESHLVEADPRRMLTLLVSTYENAMLQYQQLQTLNETLEWRIRDRTTELETFSYSVSHDLRAPLRAIDGFSRILLEEYATTLDAEGRRLLNVVHDSAIKLSRFIDDLLAFSQVGRVAIKTAPVDMQARVRGVLADLQEGTAQPHLPIEIGTLPPTRGDPTMLGLVWTNLISNALKFTASKLGRRIEIAANPGNGETVYFVRDNGVGFDMQYAGKLFGVFQRLHGAEFPGTGMGLAIVKRIVARHGGRVWAEGRPNEGATFYFSIPHQEVSHA